VLNTRSIARIQHLLPGHKYGLFLSPEGCALAGKAKLACLILKSFSSDL